MQYRKRYIGEGCDQIFTTRRLRVHLGLRQLRSIAVGVFIEDIKCPSRKCEGDAALLKGFLDLETDRLLDVHICVIVRAEDLVDRFDIQRGQRTSPARDERQ